MTSSQSVEYVIIEAHFEHPRQPGDVLQIKVDKPALPDRAQTEIDAFVENIRLGLVTVFVDRVNGRTYHLPASLFRGIITHSVRVDTEDLWRMG